MADDNAKKTTDQLDDTLSQLKEIRHYSKSNVETLTAQWMLFDGELSQLKQAGKLADLVDREGQFYEALETVISDLEDVQKELTPEPDPAA